MSVNKPIIIVGTGRCGSTIFHEMFGEHPNLAWFTPGLEVFPDKMWLHHLGLKLIELPVVGDYFRKKWAYPFEGYKIWDLHCKGFSRSFRDLKAQDATVRVKKRLPKAFAKLTTEQRNRLLIKITGWPRMGLLNEIFPDAKFIHIVRDGRAVANSIINIDWWEGWTGDKNWRWGELTDEQKATWEKHNQSFVALAGIELEIYTKAMNKAVAQIPKERFMEIRYEDFCKAPMGTFKSVCDFCEVEWNTTFHQKLQKYTLKDTNFKWQTELTKEQQFILNETLSEFQTNYGYLEPEKLEMETKLENSNAL